MMFENFKEIRKVMPFAVNTASTKGDVQSVRPLVKIVKLKHCYNEYLHFDQVTTQQTLMKKFNEEFTVEDQKHILAALNNSEK